MKYITVSIEEVKTFFRNSYFRDNDPFRCWFCDKFFNINIMGADYIKKVEYTNKEELSPGLYPLYIITCSETCFNCYILAN